MGYRIFRDSHGTEWQTFDVVPRLGERRMCERRARVPTPVPVDRRTREDRRVATGHRQVLSARLNTGWLCFEADHEKRRLAPIPSDWQRCGNARLEEYCEQALPARRQFPDTPLGDPNS